MKSSFYETWATLATRSNTANTANYVHRGRRLQPTLSEPPFIHSGWRGQKSNLRSPPPVVSIAEQFSPTDGHCRLGQAITYVYKVSFHRQVEERRTCRTFSTRSYRHSRTHQERIVAKIHGEENSLSLVLTLSPLTSLGFCHPCSPPGMIRPWFVRLFLPLLRRSKRRIFGRLVLLWRARSCRGQVQPALPPVGPSLTAALALHSTPTLSPTPCSSLSARPPTLRPARSPSCSILSPCSFQDDIIPDSRPWDDTFLDQLGGDIISDHQHPLFFHLTLALEQTTI